jgi:hypothetical protein
MSAEMKRNLFGPIVLGRKHDNAAAFLVSARGGLMNQTKNATSANTSNNFFRTKRISNAKINLVQK